MRQRRRVGTTRCRAGREGAAAAAGEEPWRPRGQGHAGACGWERLVFHFPGVGGFEVGGMGRCRLG